MANTTPKTILIRRENDRKPPKTILIRRENDRKRSFIVEVLGTHSEYPRLGEKCLLDCRTSGSVAPLRKWAANNYPGIQVEVK